MKRQIIVGIVTMFLLSVAYFPFNVSYAEDNNSTALSVILYDTNQYGAGTGTELTTSGAIINDWQYDTSKFLQINPNVPDDGNIYSITVKMPKEFYAVTNSVSAPVGYSSATFTKNTAITATNYYSSTKTYNLNNYSGTFKYTLESGVTSGTIQMEIQDAFLFSIPYKNNWHFVIAETEVANESEKIMLDVSEKITETGELEDLDVAGPIKIK